VSCLNATRRKAACTCVFMKHHGVACRHLLAVLLQLLRAKMQRTTASADRHVWDDFKLTDLFNMNLVSKHKYHAACFATQSQKAFLDGTLPDFALDSAFVREHCHGRQPDENLPVAGLELECGDRPVEGVESVLQRIKQGPTQPARTSSRPHALTQRSGHLMFDQIYQLADTIQGKDYVFNTMHTMIDTLERLKRNPATLNDDQRRFSGYDFQHNRDRTGRGGLVPDRMGMLLKVVHPEITSNSTPSKRTAASQPASPPSARSPPLKKKMLPCHLMRLSLHWHQSTKFPHIKQPLQVQALLENLDTRQRPQDQMRVLQPSLLTRTAIMKKVGHFSKAEASPRMCEKHAACLDLHLMPETRMRSAC